MIHYHGTPISPTPIIEALSGRNFCVSFAASGQIRRCHEIGQSVLIDNGAFSFWRSGSPCVDWEPYYDFAARWLDYKTTWAIIPDVIDGTESDNNDLMTQWFAAFGDFRQASPVWHLHESFDRLDRLTRNFEKVCIGSSGEYASVGTRKWRDRMDAAFTFMCKGTGKVPCWVHMLRGMNLSGTEYPFSSVDSTNIARNHNSIKRRGNLDEQIKWAVSTASRLDSLNNSPYWLDDAWKVKAENHEEVLVDY